MHVDPALLGADLIGIFSFLSRSQEAPFSSAASSFAAERPLIKTRQRTSHCESGPRGEKYRMHGRKTKSKYRGAVSVARGEYKDALSKMPREYWDYENLTVHWG